ncbi:UNVERIFIED_CONTAM: Double-stranded RNA-binding protein 4 [Sesamum calycinum]|uniref:Double-stranded RNA-binding protein 4 n=1 Tax=Sesamum calycinum TaxID=2727403 RepID=A0AAW2SUV6_9LAMI
MTRNHVGSARADLCTAKGGRSPSPILCQIITMSVPPDPLPLPLPPPAPVSIEGIPEDFWFKNRLQEFTQKPPYHFQYMKLLVKGFHMHPGLDLKYGWTEHALHPEDSIFCKSIIYEYAQKMNLQPPTYVTNESKAMLPIFVSSLVLNGVTYVGEAGKNKKEAEQFAARSAILSILDSESSTTMSEIVKSKFKLYDALKTVMDSSSVQVVNVPSRVNPLEDSAAISLVNKRKEIDVGEGSSTDPFATISKSSSVAPLPAIQLMIPESTPEQFSNTQVVPQFLHEFKKPKSQTSLPAVAPPIVFVPPASEQAVISSTSGKKRNRKNKKTKKKVLDQPPKMQVNNSLDSSEPPCFVGGPNEQLTLARLHCICCPIPSNFAVLESEARSMVFQFKVWLNSLYVVRNQACPSRIICCL